MPIAPAVLQRRFVEVGRIRIGQKVPTGNGKTRPDKLDRFRFTSPHQRHVEALADLYGGQVKPWESNGQQWEVISDARVLPVVVIPGGFSQWMETWSGGGCVHRCDGVTDQVTGQPCREQDPAHVNAKPTTRLSLMLRDLDALGAWRLESHGWNAAAELPDMVETASLVGRFVRASLTLADRVKVADGRTSRFVVPVLDLEVTPDRLAAIGAGGEPKVTGHVQIAGGAQAAIDAAPAPHQPEDPTPAPARQDGPTPIADTAWPDAIARVTSKDQARILWDTAPPQWRDALVARVAQLDAQQPADDAPVDAVLEDDDQEAVNRAWRDLVSAMADAGHDRLDAVDELLAGLYPATTPGKYTAQQMTDALGIVPRATTNEQQELTA